MSERAEYEIYRAVLEHLHEHKSQRCKGLVRSYRNSRKSRTPHLPNRFLRKQVEKAEESLRKDFSYAELEIAGSGEHLLCSLEGRRWGRRKRDRMSLPLTWRYRPCEISSGRNVLLIAHEHVSSERMGDIWQVKYTDGKETKERIAFSVEGDETIYVARSISHAKTAMTQKVSERLQSLMG